MTESLSAWLKTLFYSSDVAKLLSLFFQTIFNYVDRRFCFVFFTFGSSMFISIYVHTTLKDKNVISDHKNIRVCCITIKIEKKSCLKASIIIHDNAFHSLLPSDVQHNDTLPRKKGDEGRVGDCGSVYNFYICMIKISPLAKNKPAEISKHVGLGAAESSLAPEAPRRSAESLFSHCIFGFLAPPPFIPFCKTHLKAAAAPLLSSPLELASFSTSFSPLQHLPLLLRPPHGVTFEYK